MVKTTGISWRRLSILARSKKSVLTQLNEDGAESIPITEKIRKEESTMNEGLNLQLQDIFFTYVLPALALILTSIASWVGTVIIKYLTDKRDDRKLKEALERANKEIMAAVSSVMQTFVNSLKEGKNWTEETGKEAQLKAYLAAKSRYRTSGMEITRYILHERWRVRSGVTYN